MRNFLHLLFSAAACVTVLGACQTLQRPEAPLVSAITPIARPLTIGNASAYGVAFHHVTKLQFQKEGRTGKAEIFLDGFMDHEVQGDSHLIAFQFVKAEATKSGLDGDITKLNKFLAELKGLRVQWSMTKKTSTDDLKFTRDGVEIQLTQAQKVAFLAQIQQAIKYDLGGQAVSQGQEFFNAPVRDLLPTSSITELFSSPDLRWLADAQITGTAVGIATFDGRPVLAARFTIRGKAAGGREAVVGTSYIDVATGLGSLGSFTLPEFINAAGARVTVTAHHWLKFPSSVTPNPVKPEQGEPPMEGSGQARPIAVRWQGYSDLMAGTAYIRSRLGEGSFTVKLPNNDGTCRGTFRSTSPKNGVWSVACTNGLAASGVSQLFGAGKGSSGTGTDALGREVTYTLGTAQ